jgi:hypothetical protein
MSEQDINWNLVINENGVLMTKNDNIHASFKEVVGVRPAFDIKKEEQFCNFLGQVSKKNFDEALIFIYKY